ncbi:COG0720 6-pyruvoyl-tetrahydropterin synthase [uncultured Caudovirales phage]|uniref:COG0720 6-pyruvoyl-tetrahydropterin synthase n=1 Tax=uncultured Caudovirales phage TaxID=2100421 RepID=A0A6J7XCN6_9CAUD|nr:COG0720 6-pyruvoyl-tetrahydropterin synthase [uncultured Caudovirales phage]CAB5226724.1 COG0720 6-pyruvoyl-tetrahydropterin synthase [uncultured Caudovirales phage]
MRKHQVKRYHDISCGHRVVGHEGKCRFLHGHNYRVHFVCEAENNLLDDLGRVIDFGVVKSALCMWLEDNWDHKFLAWEEDAMITAINDFVQWESLQDSFVFVPFNPTAENMAEYLVSVIGPQQLIDTGIILTEVTIEETRKCSVTYAG